jgi:Subtilase family
MKKLLLSAAFCALCFALPGLAQTRSVVFKTPQNLGSGLRELVEMRRLHVAGTPELDLRGKALAVDLKTGERRLIPSARHAMLADRQNRVLTTIHLDGTAAIEDVRKSLGALGIAIAAENLEYRDGALSAYVPLGSGETLASLPGVSAVKLVQRPVSHAGSVTSEGAKLLNADQVNAAGITGQGITVGILSDSFNGVSAAPTAYDDVTSGDLPNVGVPDGRPGLKFLSDGGDDIDGYTDEGRAMAQVVYDVAPGVSLCFATAFLGEASFASNIRRLRRDSSCFADVIVDDIEYLDEPFFSDGQIAQAVSDVVTSTTMAGKPVSYISATGNDGGTGYAAPLLMMADATARGLTGQKVNLSTIPATIDTSGGFHNFNPALGGAPALGQFVTLTGVESSGGIPLVLQWDDAYDFRGGISTDLNLLIFDSNGNYITAFNDNNFSTLEPLEGNTISSSGSYYFVIARTGRGTHLASQVRYIAFVSNTNATIAGDYVSYSQPTVFGHSGSLSTISVGAYWYDNGLYSSQYTPELETYSSAGPVILSIDSSGKRLSTPQTLQKPDISGPDCVSTTMNYFTPFCGTSAAAPHVAGVAALLLQNAGGPGSLTSDAIRSGLQQSAGSRDLDPFFSQASLSAVGASVTLSSSGTYLELLNYTDRFFTIAFTSTTAGQTLTGLTIDLSPAPANVYFDPTGTTGYPLKASANNPAAVVLTSPTPSAKTPTLALTFTGFTTGNSFSFGIPPELKAFQSGTLIDSADLLAGATVTATLSNGTTLTGEIVNKTGTGYSAFDGFGLINAATAITAKEPGSFGGNDENHSRVETKRGPFPNDFNIDN